LKLRKVFIQKSSPACTYQKLNDIDVPRNGRESCGSFFKDSSGTVKLKWMLEFGAI